MAKQMINQLQVNTSITTKFKTISFAMVFFSEYTQKNIILNHILSQLLSTSSKKYPTKKDFANRVYELYHTNFLMFSRNYDQTLMTVLLVTIVNPKLIKEENYFKDVRDFFWQSILEPKMENNLFLEKDFFEEKKLMIANIQNMYNNKESYAYNRLIEEMAPNEVINIKPFGTIEMVNQVTLEDLTNYYHYLLKDCDCKGYAIGDITQDMVNYFFAYVPFKSTFTDKKLYSYPVIIPHEIRSIEEKQDVNQGKLVLGYRTNIHYFDHLYFALVLLDLMLTGMTTSSLFKVVREQYGLVYSIHSSVQYDAKILTIHAGIDQKNKEKTIKLIGKIMLDFQNNIDEDLFQMAKETLISYYTEVKDDCQSMIIFQIRTDVTKNMNIDQIISAIQAVHSNQIKDAAKKIHLDTIYFLSGDNYE